MVKIKLVISDKNTGKAYQIDAENVLTGLEIGNEFDGGKIGLKGYKLKITGGSNKDGTPMRSDLPGSGRKKVLFRKSGVGFKQTRKGERRRKIICGRRVTGDIVQINTVISQYGEVPIEEAISKIKTES